MTYQLSFITQTKLVNFVILAASFHYNKLISISEGISFDETKYQLYDTNLGYRRHLET